MTRRRFFALRAVSLIFKILSWVTIVLTIISAVFYALAILNHGNYLPAGIQITDNGPASTVGTAFGIILSGLFSALILYAVANLLDAVVEIDANGRRANELLEIIARVPPDQVRR